MANNSNRKAIEFMVQGALPPHSTNVLWMDTSVPTLPVLKIFENGAWATVHTEQGKIDELLVKTVLQQAKVIEELADGVDIKIDEIKTAVNSVGDEVNKVSGNIETLQGVVATESNATSNKNEIKQEIRNVAGDCILPDFEESLLATDKSEGYPIVDNDGEINFDLDYNAEYCDSYHIGSIIKIGELPQHDFDYYYAKSVDDSAPQYEGQGLHFGEDGYIHGITESLVVQEGHYYRVTGIYDLYDKYCLEVLQRIFTYEEVTATITDLGKQLHDKIDNQVAKESTAQEIKELVLQEGIILGNEYAQTINDIVGDFSNE